MNLKLGFVRKSEYYQNKLILEKIKKDTVLLVCNRLQLCSYKPTQIVHHQLAAVQVGK